MNVWFSKRTGEVLVAFQPDAARRLVSVVEAETARGRIVDPVLVQLRDQIRVALRDAPAGV